MVRSHFKGSNSNHAITLLCHHVGLNAPCYQLLSTHAKIRFCRFPLQNMYYNMCTTQQAGPEPISYCHTVIIQSIFPAATRDAASRLHKDAAAAAATAGGLYPGALLWSNSGNVHWMERGQRRCAVNGTVWKIIRIGFRLLMMQQCLHSSWTCSIVLLKQNQC